MLFRSNAFLARVTMNLDDLLELHQRQPAELNTWMRNLLLYEPDSQLYLLDAQGVVLSSTGSEQLMTFLRLDKFQRLGVPVTREARKL